MGRNRKVTYTAGMAALIVGAVFETMAIVNSYQAAVTLDQTKYANLRARSGRRQVIALTAFAGGGAGLGLRFRIDKRRFEPAKVELAAVNTQYLQYKSGTKIATVE
jgi:hypothetical protein